MIFRATRRFNPLLLFCLLPGLISCRSPQATTSSGLQPSEQVKLRSAPAGATANVPKAFFPEMAFEFGEVLSGAVVEHDFNIDNHGSAPMIVNNVSMTTPLLVTQMPHQVLPGAEGKIHFKLDTGNLSGKFAGTILVSLNDPATPQARLLFSGHVVPPIVVTPRPAFFVAGQRDQRNRASIEIVNHESQPLTIGKIACPVGRFTTRLETISPGRRYRLTLVLNPHGPGGKASEIISIRTSSKRMPLLEVGANTYLYERVHAFPDDVNFGTWHIGDSGDPTITLMIHQEGGTNFTARFTTDIPCLSVKPERGPKGDRYQAEVSLILQKIPPGPIKGSIFINTNDPAFPKITVPVNGQMLER